MDKVISIRSLKERKSDFPYWQSKSELERLATIETLRQQYIKFKYPDAQPGFQRVCTVTKQK
jgi:hypothetical protein